MTDDARKFDYWVDELRGKHECGRYRDPIPNEVDHAGRTLTLLSPFPLERAEILSTTLSESGKLLYLIAKEPDRWNEPPFSGILIVAECRGPDTYAVTIWHELYPWAFEYLGL